MKFEKALKGIINDYKIHVQNEDMEFDDMTPDPVFSYLQADSLTIDTLKTAQKQLQCDQRFVTIENGARILNAAGLEINFYINERRIALDENAEDTQPFSPSL